MTPEYPDEHGNGWQEWSKYVLKELERLNACYLSIDKRMQQTALEVAMLKVKAGVWGAVGGAIPIGLGLMVWLVKSAK